MLIGTNTVTRTNEAQAYYHVTGISVGSDLSITGSGNTSRLIIGGSDAAKYGSDGIDAGSSLYIKDCVVQANGHGAIEPGYTGIYAEDELVIENSTVTAASTGFGCGIRSKEGNVRIDEASHVKATSEAAGGAVKLSEYGSLYIGSSAYKLDAGAAKLEVKDGAVTEGAKIITPAELYVNGMDMLADSAAKPKGVSYDADTNTLTLNNAEINKGHEEYGIYADGSLIVELVGKNKVGGDGASLEIGVKIEGNLTFTGDGSLEAAGCSVEGISVTGSLTVGGGSLTGAADGGDGISVAGDMTVTGGEVTGTTDGEDSDGISLNGNLTAYGGTVTGSAAAADSNGISVDRSLTVDGGSVTGSADSENGDGVYVSESFTVNGGTVTGTADGSVCHGIYAASDLTVNGGSLSGTGADASGVYVLGGLTVNDGSVSGSAADGGGVYVLKGGLTVTGGTVTGTSSGADGAGISVLFADLTVTGGTVTGTATGAGGYGVFVWSDMTVDGGSVTGTAADGSGVFVIGSLTMTDGVVSGEGGVAAVVCYHSDAAEADEIIALPAGCLPAGCELQEVVLTYHDETDGEPYCVTWASIVYRGGTLTYDEDAGFLGAVREITLDARPDEPGRPAPKPEPEPEELPFTDLDEGAWYAEAVRYVYDAQLMTGVTETDFAPDCATTRGMIVTMLFRMEDEPEVTGGSAFSDAAESAWYADAVSWAAENDIVGGYGGGLFGPDDSITREQLAVILYRFALYKGYDLSAGEDFDLSAYADAGDVSEWAIPAMQWACGAGIINGDGGGALAPQGEATRAQVAAMLMRFIESV